MEIDKNELLSNLHRLIEISFFICHDTIDYRANKKIIEKAIKKIENGEEDEIMNEKVDICD